MTPPAGKGCLPWGALDGLTKLRAGKTLRSSVYSDNMGDTSRSDELTRPLTSALEGAWRTPTLRNVALTAPYMHDGLYETLEEVVAHYNRGGDPGAPGVRAVQIRPLGLTDGEQGDLVAFLHTLTETGMPAWGTVGAGGAPGTVGTKDAGGSGGGPFIGPDAGIPPVCRGTPPSTPLITGSTSSPAGAVYIFAAPGLAPPTVIPLPTANGASQGWQVLWTPGPVVEPAPTWAGFGVGFGHPSCVDASAFTGISFTVSGDLGTCTLQLSLLPSEDNAVTNGPVGSCVAAMCVPPFSAPVGVGTTVMPFSEVSGGSPMPTVDVTALNGVQWLLNAPTAGDAASCSASFTVSDVAFVP